MFAGLFVWLMQKLFRKVIQCHTLHFHIHIGCVLVSCFTLEISTSNKNQPTAEDYSIKQYLKFQLVCSRFFQASWHEVLTFTTILASKYFEKSSLSWSPNICTRIQKALFGRWGSFTCHCEFLHMGIVTRIESPKRWSLSSLPFSKAACPLVVIWSMATPLSC